MWSLKGSVEFFKAKYTYEGINVGSLALTCLTQRRFFQTSSIQASSVSARKLPSLKTHQISAKNSHPPTLITIIPKTSSSVHFGLTYLRIELLNTQQITESTTIKMVQWVVSPSVRNILITTEYSITFSRSKIYGAATV